MKPLGVELSPIAVEQFWSESGPEPKTSVHGSFKRTEADDVTLYCGDIFELSPQDIPDVGGLYDRAAIIALRPDLRGRYAKLLGKLLPSGSKGLIVTLSYDQERMDGPPFSVSPDDLDQLLKEDFMITCLNTRLIKIENPRMQKANLPALHRHIFQIERR